MIKINPIPCGGGFARTPPRRFQPPLCGGCTNQSQISWLFPIWSLLSSGKVIFHFFCNFFKKNAVKIFFRPKKERFFDENGQKHCLLTNTCIFCFNYVISMLWEIFWGALHVCRSKIGDVQNSCHTRDIFESLRPRGCSWRGYATQEADQELKWKLRTISVWENWVLEFLGSHSWDIKGGSARTPPPHMGQYLKKPIWNRVKLWKECILYF